MRLLEYVEIKNFKRFGDTQRVELDHPSVLIGPNNCGKTSAIQAIALWSQAVKTWFENKGKAPPRKRTSTSLNRLNIVSVPVRTTRYLWHNTAVRTGNQDIALEISVGVFHEDTFEPVTMQFRNHGSEVVYCKPDSKSVERLDLIAAAAKIDVELLYPMSGIETDEPILRSGRIDVLLGQGQTGQVLRNLCLIVLKNSPDSWSRIVSLMKRLFSVDLEDPIETSRGSIDLFYHQENTRDALDISLAGHGLRQMLLIFAYLYSHPQSVLLIDEPDAHLEILRQKQIYILLRDIASENDSQVVLATHSEVILEEALDQNLTLLIDGKPNDLAAQSDIRNALKHFGTRHYVRARQLRHVMYVEGGSDLDILREFARKLGHQVAEIWDERINAFYVQDNFPDAEGVESQLERVEGGFGITPKKHFFALQSMVPELKGLAILDSDGRARSDSDDRGLRTTYWKRYEIENYIVAPNVLASYLQKQFGHTPLFVESGNRLLENLILARIFDGNREDFSEWKSMGVNAARLFWESKTERVKLSRFAEDYFRELAEELGHAMLLRKGNLHKLIEFVDENTLPPEVENKLDLLRGLWT